MAHESGHHHHHHDSAAANAEHFTKHAHSYRNELSLELARRCAGVILKHYPFDSNSTEALDFACGPGLVAFELLSHVKRLVGVDSAQGMIDVANKTVQEQGISSDKMEFIKIDSLKGDESDVKGQLFDVAFCVQSYHHFDNPADITRLLAQRLKPKGRLIVIDFLADEGVKTLFERKSEEAPLHYVPHKHGFSVEQMTDVFNSAGLKNVQVENAFKISKSEIKMYKGYEVFGKKSMETDEEFTLQYFVAHGEKA